MQYPFLSALVRKAQWTAYLSLLTLVASCGGGESVTPTGSERLHAAAVLIPAQDITVTSMTKVSEIRVSRTVFEYVFRVSIKNSGITLLTNVTGTLGRVGTGTTIVDANFGVGSLASGATVVANDTITVRHDRNVPFLPELFVWSFSAIQTPTGVPIPGAPNSLAIGEVVDFSSTEVFSETEYQTDASRGGHTILRSKLTLIFRLDATVDQVNSLIASVDGSVIRTHAQTAVVEIRIPDPGTSAALDAIVAKLRASPILEVVQPTVFKKLKAVPSQFTLPGVNAEAIAHHLSAGAGTAWNSRGATSAPGSPTLGPVVLVQDFFARGKPADRLLPGVVGGFATSGDPRDGHGYHVLGIIGGAFNSPTETDDNNEVTGIFPGPRRLVSEVDDLGVKDGRSDDERLWSLMKTYRLISRKVVVNTSLGYDAGISEIFLDNEKKIWLSYIRGGNGEVRNAAVEEKFFHSIAAGNDPLLPARNGGGYHRAAVDGDLKNSLTVENRAADRLNPTKSLCLNNSSSRGGNVSAIGSLGVSEFDEGVWSYGNVAGSPIRMNGTSMAAPQVAGLAAYMWSVKADLSAEVVAQAISGNTSTRNTTCISDDGKPLIDAFASILAVDDSSALLAGPASAPARISMLDLVGNDNAFTFNDAKEFVDAFVALKDRPTYIPISTRTLSNSVIQDISRFDLNGDGKIGGIWTGRVNLAIDYSPGTRISNYNNSSFRPLDGLAVSLDDSNVTDLEVLCFYANSGLFDDRHGGLALVEVYLSTKSLSCIGSLGSVSLAINQSVSGWGGLPGVVQLSSLYGTTKIAFRATGNSATCGNQGEPIGERGIDAGGMTFSQSVDSDAIFLGARISAGVPYFSGAPNRNNCSSFFAYKSVSVPGRTDLQGKFWFNGSGRAVFGFGGSIVSDWEYQVRYYSGDPLLNYADRKVYLGTVPGSGFFNPGFELTAVTLSYSR